MYIFVWNTDLRRKGCHYLSNYCNYVYQSIGHTTIVLKMYIQFTFYSNVLISCTLWILCSAESQRLLKIQVQTCVWEKSRSASPAIPEFWMSYLYMYAYRCLFISYSRNFDARDLKNWKLQVFNLSQATLHLSKKFGLIFYKI